MPQGTGGKAGGDASSLIPRVLGEFSLLLAPSQWMLDLGGDGKLPDLLAGLVSCEETEKAENP